MTGRRRLALALAALAWGAVPRAGRGEAPGSAAALPSAAWRFVDVAAEVGLDYRLEAGSPTKSFIPEAMPGGVAWIDYDLDGDQDLFFCQGGHGAPPRAGASGGPGPPPALFRNALSESGRATFTNVTADVGLAGAGNGAWGMGVSVADFDGDGDLDLLLTGLGPLRLYRNELVHDGQRQPSARFTEVAASLGLLHASWSTGAAFSDVDGDGDLDLFVASYVDFDPAFRPKNEVFTHWRGISVFPGPVGLAGAPDRFFRNQLAETGRASFVDATRESGLEDADRDYGFSVLFVDYDDDGDADLYLANDSRPNRLYRNDGKGRFADVAFRALAAYSEDGKAQASMGAAAGDCDGDGAMDLIVTNFSYDYDTLYRNTRRGTFEDVSYAAGIGEATYRPLAFGVTFADADADGDEDLYIANGHIYPQVDSRDFGTTYGQTNLLFENVGAPTGACRLRAVTDGGPGLATRKVSRGCAAADYDGDGDLDLVVNELDAAPTLLRNDTPQRGGWLGVRCRGSGANTFGVGARVTATSGDRRQVREIRTSASYLSVEPPTAWFGLGAAKAADVSVRFASGRIVVVRAVTRNQVIDVSEPRP